MPKRKPASIEPPAPPAKPQAKPQHEPTGTAEAIPTAVAQEAPIAIALPPAERQARAEHALAHTQERIRTLGEALATIEPRRAALAAQPNLVHAAEARLYVVVSTPTEASARQALAAAREHAERVSREEAEARAILAATRAGVVQDLAELAAETERLEAEREHLASISPHLQSEVVDAWHAVGEELLAAAQERQATLRAEVAAAEARLAELKAAAERHHADVAALLSDHPETHLAARQAGLLADEPPGVVERLLIPYLAFLRALETAPRLEAMPLFDHVSLSTVLGGLEPGRLHYALTADRSIITPHMRYVEQLLTDLAARRCRG